MRFLSSNEKTSLTIAIIHNNHSVLRLFTDRNYEYTTTARLNGGWILPYKKIPFLFDALAKDNDVKKNDVLTACRQVPHYYP